MDCDCELLRNEGPSIPVYGFFLSHHRLASLYSHIHYACICSEMQLNE